MPRNLYIQSRNLSDLPDDAIIRLPDVLRIYPVSSSTWWDGVKSGRFPASIKLGPRTTGWRLGDVLAITRKLTGSTFKQKRRRRRTRKLSSHQNMQRKGGA